MTWFCLPIDCEGVVDYIYEYLDYIAPGNHCQVAESGTAAPMSSLLEAEPPWMKFVSNEERMPRVSAVSPLGYMTILITIFYTVIVNTLGSFRTHGYIYIAPPRQKSSLWSSCIYDDNSSTYQNSS